MTFYSNEEIWKAFSAKILEEEGTTRKISMKLQELISDYLLNDFFERLLETFKIKENYIISSSEIKKKRPEVKG
ncbi:MAG: hypothetical protein ACTSO9_12540 [Candidatus Helarchaeota archaeon]